MRYRIRDGQVRFATNAFFFQEDDAGLYAKARYGEFRVARDGETILTGLRDEDLMSLGKRLEVDRHPAADGRTR